MVLNFQLDTDTQPHQVEISQVPNYNWVERLSIPTIEFISLLLVLKVVYIMPVR